MRTIFIITLIAFQFCATAQPGNNLNASSAFYIPVASKFVYKLGDRNIGVSQLQYGDNNGIICINLHDNEHTSVKAAKIVLQTTGGTLLRIENNGYRVIKFRVKNSTYIFDPNRMFSLTGINQSLRENGRWSPEAADMIDGFASFVKSLLPDSAYCIVALHNNTEEQFSVKSYLPGGSRQRDAKAVFADSLQDVDDIALTTDSIIYKRLADLRYNSIWQDNAAAKKDGSLSILFGETGRRYVNIETQHGREEQYVRMLGHLFAILTEELTPPSSPEETN